MVRVDVRQSFLTLASPLQEASSLDGFNIWIALCVTVQLIICIRVLLSCDSVLSVILFSYCEV